MRDCHSRVSSLQADVVSKSASQRINQSFAPKASGKKTLGWGETPSDRWLDQGDGCVAQHHKQTNKQTHINKSPCPPRRRNCNLARTQGSTAARRHCDPTACHYFKRVENEAAACSALSAATSPRDHCDAATPADTGRGRGAGRPRRALRYEALVRPTNDGQPSQ